MNRRGALLEQVAQRNEIAIGNMSGFVCGETA